MKPFPSKAARVVALVLRMALGALFIVSAIAKLIGIDRFEIYIFSFNLLPLTWSMMAARLVIVAELLVGIGLMANIAKRLVDTCALLMLVCFTLFLGYAALSGRTDSCQCMGSLVEFDPLQSIAKNAVLLLLLVVAMGARPWSWRPRWFVWLPVVLAPTVAVFVLSAPDNWLFGPSDEIYNAEQLDSAIAPDGELAPLKLAEGRHAVAFLSPGCQFCRMADEKLTHICRRNGLDSTAFVYIIPAADSTVAPLTLDTVSFIRPGHLVPPMTFALITYGQRPMLMLMENGKVTATCHYRNINAKQIVDFLK
jgi:uncharacterized membrane protein YphA (DoxX/SURF4 family)